MNKTLQISFQNSQPLLLEFFQSPLKNTGLAQNGKQVSSDSGS